MRQEVYFLSSQKTKPSLFGLPLVVPCNAATTHQVSENSSIKVVAICVPCWIFMYSKVDKQIAIFYNIDLMNGSSR